MNVVHFVLKGSRVELQLITQAVVNAEIILDIIVLVRHWFELLEHMQVLQTSCHILGFEHGVLLDIQLFPRILCRLIEVLRHVDVADGE
jgi:hypothetical protein